MRSVVFLFLALVGVYAAIRVSPPAARRAVGGFLLRHFSPVFLIFLVVAALLGTMAVFGPITFFAP